jgi:hypothetical protein
MKTLVIKETQAPYTLTLDEATLAEGPVMVLCVGSEGERVVGVLVPPEEYAAFRAWREAQQGPVQSRQAHEEFEREAAAFERLLPELLKTYRGRVVAIRNGQVIDAGKTGESVVEVAERVYNQIGYVPVYIQQVEETLQVRRISGPRLAQQ